MAARLPVEDEAGAGYRFANDLVREVLYRTSPRPTRVTRHRRLAAMLADRPEAARSYANRDAERLLDQAVAAATEAGDPALEAAARLDRGRALVALGDYPAAFADQEQALRLATAHGLDRLEAAALEQLGWTAYYSRDHQAASELTPQARELAERAVAAPRAAPTALLLAARMRHAEGDLAGAREAFDAVLGEPDPATQTALLERLLADVEDRFYHARAATTGSWLWRELGDPGRALALADRATELLGPPPPAPTRACTPSSPWPSAPCWPATTARPRPCWSGPAVSWTGPSATAGGSSCATPS
jgi:tetratricopeptide (TPR) repeat protein